MQMILWRKKGRGGLWFNQPNWGPEPARKGNGKSEKCQMNRKFTKDPKPFGIKKEKEQWKKEMLCRPCRGDY